jgi:CDP-diacylglycerol---serine O-phosphatidyltransferase
MNQEKKQFKIVSAKRTRYILPNILTLGGVCLGISSIKFSIDGNFSLAVIFILVAAILDALDGRIARLIKGTSEFGKELDSLTDFVSFGIAPAFVLYFWELYKYGKIGWAITLIFSICCVIRLARFNLTKIDSSELWKQNYFEGIPSPIGALLILMPLIYELSDLEKIFNLRITTPYLIVTISLLLISKFPTFSFKKISIPPKLTIILLLSIGLSFVSLMFFTFEILILFGICYFITIPVAFLTYIKKNNNRSEKPSEEEHEDIL